MAKQPVRAVPPGATDTHLHIYGPPARYPLAASSRKDPPFAADLAAYRRLMARLGTSRAVVVQPSAYGMDNSATMDAVAGLGDGGRAVVVVTPQTPQDELLRLHEAGARGARFYLGPGAPQGWEALAPTAARIAPLGWHVQLQFDGAELAEREAVIRALPCDAVIDHLARFSPPPAVDDPNYRTLLRLLEGGRLWLKASAPYHGSRIGAPHYPDMAPVARDAIRIAPGRILWATNWPHPNPPGYPIDEADLLDVLGEWTPDEATRHRILVDNPALLYGWR